MSLSSLLKLVTLWCVCLAVARVTAIGAAVSITLMTAVVVAVFSQLKGQVFVSEVCTVAIGVLCAWAHRGPALDGYMLILAGGIMGGVMWALWFPAERCRSRDMVAAAVAVICISFMAWLSVVASVAVFMPDYLDDHQMILALGLLIGSVGILFAAPFVLRFLSIWALREHRPSAASSHNVATDDSAGQTEAAQPYHAGRGDK